MSLLNDGFGTELHIIGESTGLWGLSWDWKREEVFGLGVFLSEGWVFLLG